MPLSKRLYPYQVTSQLSLRLTAEPYDPENEKLDFSLVLRQDASDEDVQTLDLSGSEQPWSTLKLDVEVRVPDADLSRVLPPLSDPKSDAALLVIVTCSDTRVRRPTLLEYVSGVWVGSVIVRRHEARGAVRLTPRLVRTTALRPANLETGDGGGVATERSFVVGEGRSFDIRIDPPPPTEGILRVRWEDFSESAHDWRRRHANDLFYLEQDESHPTLFLNSYFSELKAALHSRGTVGGAAIIRHLTNASIAQAVWVQLFTSALATVERDDDSGDFELPAAGWRRDVLRALSSQAYPGLEVSEQLARLYSLRDEGQEGVLMTVLFSAAQAAARSSVAVKKAAAAAVVIRSSN